MSPLIQSIIFFIIEINISEQVVCLKLLITALFFFFMTFSCFKPFPLCDKQHVKKNIRMIAYVIWGGILTFLYVCYFAVVLTMDVTSAKKAASNSSKAEQIIPPSANGTDADADVDEQESPEVIHEGEPVKQKDEVVQGQYINPDEDEDINVVKEQPEQSQAAGNKKNLSSDPDEMLAQEVNKQIAKDPHLTKIQAETGILMTDFVYNGNIDDDNIEGAEE